MGSVWAWVEDGCGNQAGVVMIINRAQGGSGRWRMSSQDEIELDGEAVQPRTICNTTGVQTEQLVDDVQQLFQLMSYGRQIPACLVGCLSVRQIAVVWQARSV
jgi:hypothetical protein